MKRNMTTMTPEEKKLVQAQHRLEAAQARGGPPLPQQLT